MRSTPDGPYNWIFPAIDHLSHYNFLASLKRKSGDEVFNALKLMTFNTGFVPDHASKQWKGIRQQKFQRICRSSDIETPSLDCQSSFSNKWHSETEPWNDVSSVKIFNDRGENSKLEQYSFLLCFCDEYCTQSRCQSPTNLCFSQSSNGSIFIFQQLTLDKQSSKTCSTSSI